MRPLPIAPPLVLLAAALSACSISSDHEGFSIEIGPGLFSVCHHATETRRLPLDLQAGDLLVVEGIHGDVVVRASSEAPPELVCVLGADGRTEEEAEQALRGVEVSTRREEGALSVVVDAPARELREGGLRLFTKPRSDLTLTVPTGIRVRVGSSSGEIDVEGPIGAVQAETCFGGVTLVRIRGDASAHTDSGSIEIRQVEGDAVTAETSFGDVSLESIRAARTLAESRSGDLSLRDVRGTSIDARSSFGGIRLSAVEGDVTAETDSGDVELDGALPGTHRLHSGFGAVEALRAQGSIEATSDSGDVTVRDSAGKVSAQSGFGAVRVDGVLSFLAAESSSGDVDVEARAGSSPESDWRLTSRFGSVSLTLPPAFACSLDAATDFGSIDSDFDLALTERGAGASVRGKLASGGRSVEIHTSSGDVAVRRRAD